MPDAFARNPAIDDLRERGHPIAALANRYGTAPALFGKEDLPRYTASGNPPAALLDLPWKVRHAAAKAAQPEWARLFAEYGKGVPDADLAAEFDSASDEPANGEYLARVTRWASGFSAR